MAVIKNALKRWPSIIVADIAFIVARPSVHFLSISMGLETGAGATLSHFLAFGVFNLVAIFSRSMADYTRHVEMGAILDYIHLIARHLSCKRGGAITADNPPLELRELKVRMLHHIHTEFYEVSQDVILSHEDTGCRGRG